jgi:hypothetical protein
MKKITIPLLLAFLACSCENQYIEFPDYDFQSVYFPVQYPIRTLSLGEDRFDNSMDRELKFNIGISIGGMYENKWDWSVSYIVDESLCDNLGNGVLPLPSRFYSLHPVENVIIPVGSFSGLIDVQLTDDFLFDSLSVGNHYVIPLRITSSDADSILSGLPAITEPDKRIASHWDPAAPPKDFTLFMIKYVNEYHGSYLRRGVDYTIDAMETISDTSTYRTEYVERDQVVRLSTTGRWSLESNFIGRSTGSDKGFLIEVDQNSMNISMDSIPGNSHMLTESISGSYVKNGDSWGGSERDVLYLNYKYFDGTSFHLVFDTLVFRERGIKYEVFIPKVLK